MSYLVTLRNANGKVYDLTNLAYNISYYTDIEGQAGKLSFYLTKDDINNIDLQWKNSNLYVGDEIYFSNDRNMIFKGYVFTVGVDGTNVTKVTAYDQLRYFKNEDTLQSNDCKASDLFKELCARALVNKGQYKVVTPSNETIPSKVFHKKSYYKIMEEVINDTLVAEGKVYYLIDNAGVLEFNSLDNSDTDVVIGEKSLLTGYKYEVDIDKNTYNKVIMEKGNETDGYTKVLVAQSKETIRKWGLLQKVIKVDDNIIDSVIKQYAETFLAVSNKPNTTMTLSALGDDRIRAGKMFTFKLSRLGIDERKMYVKTCTHKYNADVHTMELEVAILPSEAYE